MIVEVTENLWHCEECQGNTFAYTPKDTGWHSPNCPNAGEVSKKQASKQ